MYFLPGDTDSIFYRSDPLYSTTPKLDENKLLGTLVSEVPKGLFIKVIYLVSIFQ